MLSDINDIYIKGRQYADSYEKHMVWISDDHILFLGKNNEHHIKRDNGTWNCDCGTFARWHSHPNFPNFCPHVIAVEKIASLLVKTVLFVDANG